MAIPPWTCFNYRTILHAMGDHAWTGSADDDGADSLLGHQPSVKVISGRVTLTRSSHAAPSRSLALAASFDGGDALDALLQEGDVLSCWLGGTAEIGLSVTRAGSLLLGLGALPDPPGAGITLEYDPRVEEVELARDIRRIIDRPGTRFVWLDPQQPSKLESRFREIDAACWDVNPLAIVARTDDPTVSLGLNRRMMQSPRRQFVFLNASERFTRVEDWLEYARGLSRDRPGDLWLNFRSGNEERLVSQGTTATIDGWLVHVFRIFERGLPGRLTQVGLVRADLGVTTASLERSTAAVAGGLDRPSIVWRTPLQGDGNQGVARGRTSAAAIAKAGGYSSPVYDWEGTPSMWEGILGWLARSWLLRIGLGITSMWMFQHC